MIGAFVVYSKLNAYVVMTHFMVGMALLAVAVVLALRAGHGPGRGTLVVSEERAVADPGPGGPGGGGAGRRERPPPGAGPHAGGKGAKRIPIGLEDMTRIHAEIVLAAGVRAAGAAVGAVAYRRAGPGAGRRTASCWW